MGAAEIRSILLPRTSTLLGPESLADLPSNTRTFWKSTIVGWTSWAIKRTEIKTVRNTRVVRSCLHFGRIAFPPLFLTTHKARADREQDLTPDWPTSPPMFRSSVGSLIAPKLNNYKRYR